MCFRVFEPTGRATYTNACVFVSLNPQATRAPGTPKVTEPAAAAPSGGCPNGCGHHHIANIGFHGAAIKGPDGEQIPAYELFLGGNYGGSRIEDSRVGARIPKVKIPAKGAPLVVREIVSHYKSNRHEGESFNDFLDRVGLDELTAVATEAQRTVTTTEAGSDLYFDWERTNIYKLERGEGECMV